MPRVTIDKKKCDNDGTCIEVCPVDVFAKEDNNVIVKNQKDCIGCRACEAQCPQKAIKVED